MAITWYIRAEISAASDIADGLDSIDKSTRELLHIFRVDPGLAEEMDDAAFAKPEPLEYTTIADIQCAAEQGDPEAQDWLGHNYYCGANGLEKMMKKLHTGIISLPNREAKLERIIGTVL